MHSRYEQPANNQNMMRGLNADVPSCSVPFLQLCPVQPGAQVQRPVTGWQCALFSHTHFSWQPCPNQPTGHAETHTEGVCYYYYLDIQQN